MLDDVRDAAVVAAESICHVTMIVLFDDGATQVSRRPSVETIAGKSRGSHSHRIVVDAERSRSRACDLCRASTLSRRHAVGDESTEPRGAEVASTPVRSG